MTKNILIIGGTRFFGKLLVRRLLAEGHQLTLATRGRTGDDFGNAVQRIHVDRRDAAAMRAAFARASYDAVYDQMCYSPLDAAISNEVFAGRTARYIMSSTIEVYRHLCGLALAPFAESALDLDAERIDMVYPWHDPAYAEESYAPGKRQAEALLYRSAALPAVSVRIAHVLGGRDDFTGRLRHYVELARRGQPLPHSSSAAASSFLHPQAIANFLAWTGTQDFLGPVNAANITLSATELRQRIGQVLGVRAYAQAAAPGAVQPGPFDYAQPYTMDTARAAALGYRFEGDGAWLDTLIREHASAAQGAAA
ncbi:NAD-dependent epimerase/dehydratase family protein [Pseudoduganella violacea]|uniref:Nucleoside-diphosphate-sugar epimerase n=1 Tax=Pseudoduganella violacea TaxID=1715466 RepID=A0A7W5BBI9_9BURK|nr:NAD-dependent epimerase/dehydratase family protein [Pseudoduganella violacea]MBB3120134.1 nucleoside-diphosphate-sugar epimerase [Pseudoduganella violacea]